MWIVLWLGFSKNFFGVNFKVFPLGFFKVYESFVLGRDPFELAGDADVDGKVVGGEGGVGGPGDGREEGDGGNGEIGGGVRVCCGSGRGILVDHAQRCGHTQPVHDELAAHIGNVPTVPLRVVGVDVAEDEREISKSVIQVIDGGNISLAATTSRGNISISNLHWVVFAFYLDGKYF